VVAGAGGAAAAFFVAVPVIPFLIVLMTVAFLVGGGGAAALVVAALGPAFRITVEVLPSLDSLMPLTRRVVRVAAVRTGGGPAPAPLRPLAAVVAPTVELAVEDVVVLRVAAARVDRAFSTMFVKRLVAAACFAGDTGRAMSDLAGEAGTAVRSRGLRREFDDAGERTLFGSGRVSARCFFLG